MTNDRQTRSPNEHSFVLQPWLLVLWAMSGWINREQQQQLEYMKTELAVLRELLGPGRILLSDDQRRRLAVAGKALGKSKLAELGTLFTPDTILRWHRRLVAAKTYASAQASWPAKAAHQSRSIDSETCQGESELGL